MNKRTRGNYWIYQVRLNCNELTSWYSSPNDFELKHGQLCGRLHLLNEGSIMRVTCVQEDHDGYADVLWQPAGGRHSDETKEESRPPRINADMTLPRQQ